MMTPRGNTHGWVQTKASNSSLHVFSEHGISQWRTCTVVLVAIAKSPRFIGVLTGVALEIYDRQKKKLGGLVPPQKN
jgi:hypothetical protein